MEDFLTEIERAIPLINNFPFKMILPIIDVDDSTLRLSRTRSKQQVLDGIDHRHLLTRHRSCTDLGRNKQPYQREIIRTRSNITRTFVVKNWNFERGPGYCRSFVNDNN